MFGNRRNSQKPNEGLINRFQATFSDVVRPTVTGDPSSINGDFNRLTPGFRFTPFLDDQSLPTPGATAHQNFTSHFPALHSVYHGPAGDLHTPTAGSSLLTPRTLLEQFAVSPLPRNTNGISYDRLDPLYFAREPQSMACGNHNPAYPPSAFVHSDLADGFVEEPSQQQFQASSGNQGLFAPHFISPEHQAPRPAERSSSEGQANNFRYQVTLNTPTAMIHDPNDAPPPLINGMVQYRTSVRVTFQEPEHVSNPAACWSLWDDVRGHEGHRKDGNAHAVEMVDLSQGNEGERYPIRLEKTSLDGFSVVWFADPTKGKSGFTIGIRFNFLSTDFSHSKGVKGAPLRLCAKTETSIPGTAELSFCYVKLFRDHGAERKMFNDVSQLKRAIEKRKEDFAKADSGDNLGKRKRGNRSVYTSDRNSESERKAELQSRMDAELATMQGIFYSNRPVTHFCLPGDQKDDPDLSPVQMIEQTQGAAKKPRHLQTLTPPSTSTSNSVSSNGSNSLVHPQVPGSQRDAGAPEWNDYSGSSNQYSRSISSETPSDNATTTHTSPELPAISTTDECEIMEVNSKLNTPAKCFYLRFKQSGIPQDDYHTAVYLVEPTVDELIEKIAQKQKFNRDQRVQLFHAKPNGMKVMIDNDVVKRIPDGQDMVAEVSDLEESNKIASATGGGSLPAAIEVRLSF
ncbi:hypothetical protein N7466_008482 [Penicillium verhagenii]|uniref:uncharacterized protein n=1 Tax=Penicillium verhagenii TaxID=1562060 RepID=UPI0025457F35|nr:uncharacterized protein N7466_008482 [Penicillium verhagenii]KAJ5924295.1 hypothetical protein N7466_008482 [Penicillium verhagenii]